MRDGAEQGTTADEARVNVMGFERIDADGRPHRQQKIVRGLARLTLDERELRVVRSVPHGEWTVPLAEVVGVETAKSHNGKRVWGPAVLRVAFPQDGGTQVLGVALGRAAAAEAWREKVAAAVRAAGGIDAPIATD